VITKNTAPEEIKTHLDVGGAGDRWLLHERQQRFLETELDISIEAGDGAFRVYGRERVLPLAEKILRLVFLSGGTLDDQELRHYLALLRREPGIDPAGFFEHAVTFPRQKKSVRARGRGQLAYLSALKKNDIVFGVGVAGTGKTYLAAAWAAFGLMQGRVSRIILVRPVVEAGESLGFLPGDLTEKIDPYLRPLHDALSSLLGQEEYFSLCEKGVIEFAPLAYMRGRTLSDAVVILDEAQNTTQAQMKMFLTRIGQNTQAIITGDITQVDLPQKTPSGLMHALSILQGIDGIEFVHFDEGDVVRHPLVRKIIAAYERNGG
jgi:phosphate starvation-inducible PhoH-like protein